MIVKKVLILSSSPRKNGNSNILCEQFSKGAAKAGHSIEKIDVHNLKINYCTGCSVCQSNGGSCVFNDDMNNVLEKMIRADVIVLATPVYFYSMTASLKALIDRTFSAFMKMSGKDFYYIVTCGGNMPYYLKSTLACLKGFVACCPDSNEKGVVYGHNAMEAGAVESLPVMQEAYKMGKSI
ncbi:MAG: flavodoxin family protein [Suipraeoptans sp.]